MYRVNPDHQKIEAVRSQPEAELAGDELEQSNQPDPSVELINGIGRVMRSGADRLKTRISTRKGLIGMTNDQDRDIPFPDDYPGI